MKKLFLLIVVSWIFANPDFSQTRNHSLGKTIYDLPFSEQWTYGSFTVNDWEISSGDWIISEESGNGAPAAYFTPALPLTGYNGFLESDYLDASWMTEGYIFLTFDLNLSSVNPTGLEQFHIQVWDSVSGNYTTVKDYDNLNGSFGWLSDTIDVRSWCMHTIFRVRFVAEGLNSADIVSWGIDNITVYRECWDVGIVLESSLENDSCIILEATNDPKPNLVDVITYVYKDQQLLKTYSINFPMPNPFCVIESGEYCFISEYVFMSESDECRYVTNITCENVILNNIEENEANAVLYLDNNILKFESAFEIDRLDGYDLSGRLLFTYTPGSKAGEFKLTSLMQGILFLRAQINGGTICRKLFVNTK